jgi:signal transduction histidine kinase
MKQRIAIILASILFCCVAVCAQKSELQQQAETADSQKEIAKARSLYIRAFEDYAGQGKIRQGAECGAKAAALYYKENFYNEAFELLRRIDHGIIASHADGSTKAAAHYQTSKERMLMYMKMRRAESAKEHLKAMETQAAQSNDEGVKNDLLYNKAIYYYTFGQIAQGNAVFKEMADKLTAVKDYEKVDEVYQTLIANGRKSNNANMVAQAYSSYIVWKDSVSAQIVADERDSLNRQIATLEATIAEKDSSLSTRQMTIVGLCVLAAVLAAVLVLGGFVLMRYIFLTRKQKRNMRIANENNALKAKFISNISAQLSPTLSKLDGRLPEVKALQNFAQHIHTLSELESMTTVTQEFEDVQVQPFCEQLMDEIRNKVKPNVTLAVNASKMSVKMNKAYVSHILQHLLLNAAEYTPEGGTISLDFKKRGPHTNNFIVTDTGVGIPEEKQEDVFKPFLEIRDLVKGDGLGLPICKQMALKMNGDLDIDSRFTKGARFVLELHV